MSGKILVTGKDGLFIKQEVGKATDELDRSFSFGLINGVVPYVHSEQSGNNVIMYWQGLIPFAIDLGIEDADFSADLPMDKAMAMSLRKDGHTVYLAPVTCSTEAAAYVGSELSSIEPMRGVDTYSHKIQLSTEEGKTKWLSIDADKFEAIRTILLS